MFPQTSKRTGAFPSTPRRRRSGPWRWSTTPSWSTSSWTAASQPRACNRPAWNGCWRWWTAGKVQTVIVAKLDRLTRSVKDLCELLERFERRGVALVSVAESLDTGSAAGRLVLNIMTAVSQWEREAIGERTRDAMSHKRSNGERVGNIQFGYRLCADGKHVEPDPAEQSVLAEIRRLRQSGHTMRGIAAALNHRALRTRRGSAWRLEHVARIVKQGVGAR